MGDRNVLPVLLAQSLGTDFLDWLLLMAHDSGCCGPPPPRSSGPKAFIMVTPGLQVTLDLLVLGLPLQSSYLASSPSVFLV